MKRIVISAVLLVLPAVAMAQSAQDQQAQFKQAASITWQFLQRAQATGAEARSLVDVMEFQKAIADGRLVVSVPQPSTKPEDKDK